MQYLPIQYFNEATFNVLTLYKGLEVFEMWCGYIMQRTSWTES